MRRKMPPHVDHSFDIQAAGANDIDSVAVFAHDAWHKLYDSYLPADLIASRSLLSVHAAIAKKRGNVLFAKSGGRVVGMSLTSMNNIDELWVDKSSRRRGIGAALVQACAGRVIERDFQSIQVGLESFNQPAIAFFQRLGWRQVGHQTESLGGNIRYQALVYALRLA